MFLIMVESDMYHIILNLKNKHFSTQKIFVNKKIFFEI